MAAALQGHTDCVKELVDAGADVNTTNKQEPRHSFDICCMSNGHADIIKILLSAGADVNHINKDQDTALLLTANTGHIHAIKILLSAGADVNHKY